MGAWDDHGRESEKENSCCSIVVGTRSRPMYQQNSSSFVVIPVREVLPTLSGFMAWIELAKRVGEKQTARLLFPSAGSGSKVYCTIVGMEMFLVLQEAR